MIIGCLPITNHFMLSCCLGAIFSGFIKTFNLQDRKVCSYSRRMGELKLLGVWPSSFVYRIIWALELKGIKYEHVQGEFHNPDFSDLLLKYNPVYKKVPVLVVDGKPIAESTVILEYIEERWPQPPMLPQDPYERAVARFWSTSFMSFFVAVGEDFQKATKEVREVLKVLEETIGDKKYFGGEEIGILDITLGWIPLFFGVIEDIVGVKVLVVDDFPRLFTWIRNFSEHPSIRTNFPSHHELFGYYKQKRDYYSTQYSMNAGMN
ncbi:probable glutathione S-transferase isoform X2 [Vigna radiata var. radiata]|uniref:glutathione transferase n=1 Tax=Vigna radiata var. radiata TaxID=3916 RepID=A0A3Q0F8M4_VIGRR|nr:probable glutathione S-transferase isoform X2 [Vigna radiata var. radiata]